MAAASSASIFHSSSPPALSSSSASSTPSITNTYAASFMGSPLREYHQRKGHSIKTKGKIRAAAVVATPPAEEIKEPLRRLNCCFET